MTAEHVQGDEPLIAMPALTPDAPRQAVAAVVPSRLNGTGNTSPTTCSTACPGRREAH
jgi:hypothetical protein